MSDVSMQSLFAAAREDAPDGATHDAMWNNVASATGMAAGASVAAAATSAAKPAAATTAAAATATLAPKLLLLGLLIGAVSAAVGGVVALGWMESQTGVAAESAATAPLARTVHVPSRGAQLADPTPRARDAQNPDRPEPSSIANLAPPVAAAATASAASATSDLAEEARLVTEARTALVSGDPSRALVLLRKTHRFANRALEPEELSLEARALRALGRADEAAATDMTLKSRFPGHALAR
jgi:hypothetical protein